MKYAISFFISLSTFGAPINLYYEDNSGEAMTYRSILINHYRIPEELISVRKINLCEELKAEGKLELCLKNNGDLYLVSVDRDFISESLKVFQAP